MFTVRLTVRFELLHRLRCIGFVLLCVGGAEHATAAAADAQPSANRAASASHIAAARAVLEVLRVRDALPPMVAQLGAVISAQIGAWNPPEDQMPEVEKTIAKINEALAFELNWQKLEEDYLVLYTESFSETELKEINRFFHSPTGGKYIASVPGIQQKSLNIDQLRFARIQPQIELLLGDLRRHLDMIELERNPPAP